MKSANSSLRLRLWVFSAMIVFFGLIVTGRADALQDAGTAFASGDFSAAARAYETALATSGPSAGLYYNLAMAQLKDGQRPQAALNLHRAIMLDPRMMDARVSLSEIERSQGVPSVPAGWRGTLAERAPLQTLVVTGCVLAWLGAFLLLYVLFKSGRKMLPAFGAVFLLLFGAAAFLAGTLADPRIAARKGAVVLAEDGINLLAAPADQSATVSRLPAGAFLTVLQRSGEWTYCRTPKGDSGWVPSSSLQSVVPAA